MMSSSLIDAVQVTKRLWVGSAPEDRLSCTLFGFSDVFLCAREYQPSLLGWPVRIHRGALDDAELTLTQAQEAERLGVEVSRAMSRGTTLVSCNRGINRAPLVAAIALQRSHGLSGIQAFSAIQGGRPNAFTNQFFARWLRERPAPERG